MSATRATSSGSGDGECQTGALDGRRVDAPSSGQNRRHEHAEQEEVYLVIGGSARAKIDEEVVELAEFDAVRIPAGVMHSLEGGPGGAELVAFGAPNTENKDAEMTQGWWSD